jgi:hypothetical protein
MDESQKWLALIDSNEFSSLFVEELGWDRPLSEKKQFVFDSAKFELTSVASYKGIQVWTCNQIPNARIQREIDKQVSKISAERLLIFYDDLEQNWRWPMSKESSGKGIVRLVNHEHIKGNKTVSLLQRLKLIQISLQSEPPTLVEMLLRLRKAFDADQITKTFYREFSKYQKQLVEEIHGLEKISDKEWYSSLLLNRLMFIYFMQWKGFMDGNQNYLADRLSKIRAIKGKNEFYGFFKDFLLPLFHKGLGAGSKITVPPEIAKIVGEIPYVNGGIFSEHELEHRNTINIPDEAFESIFKFFDEYQWHLDSRRTGNPNEINPDVLGYVFEQFVNNKDQGAYYTKEDITEYMTRNTLVIRLLQRIENECSINLLRLLAQNCERYIWPSLTWGEEFEDSLSDLTTADSLDKKTSSQSGLPAESGWETKKRIEYVEMLRKKISNGEIDNLSELVSLNIDLETLASDIIDGLDTSEDVVRIWNILSSLKIVDPTCGSGAFLFAALNQLEHLYSVLLDAGELHAKTSKNKELQELQEVVKRHPSRTYFILKHATQRNLFGVDIMREATEIARLRLFLKLISAIDDYKDIEPLPDLEFNIKAGNMLVGITQSEHLQNHISTIDAMSFVEDIENQRDHLADLWENFVSAQELGHEKAIVAKKLLNNGTAIIRSTLDHLFYESTNVSKTKQTFDEWRESTSPFHWFVEFPEVFRNGGFDIVIGNPPYINKSRVNYNTDGHSTSDCPDIYAMCMERASMLTKHDGVFTMIVMANLVFSERYVKLRDFLSKRFPTRYISGFTKIPAALFEGARVLNVIFIGFNENRELYTSPFHRWIQEFRPHLMSSIRYHKVPTEVDKTLVWPFITSPVLASEMKMGSGTLKGEVLSRGLNYELIEGKVSWDKTLGKMHPLFYKAVAYNKISAFIEPPPVEDSDGNPAQTSMLKVMWFNSEDTRDIALTLFVSRWMFAWWAMYGDDNHVTQENLLSFPINVSEISSLDKKTLLSLAKRLHKQMTLNVNWKKNAGLKIGSWDMSSSKELLGEIDKAWAEILKLSSHLEELQYQFFSTVKTDIFADEIVEEED